ncbi:MULTISPECIES: hypothetical protein [unclassified Bradyrhizobium]|uniref:hypothetical protein n=1 Tax=unclassified Bradyrhizobium TaxID=2631580 RepID=UPI00247A82F9|nr:MULTISPECIES: hypothetical protein [unclassified Bradyrhizobium]WGR73211.1 hypothetical protein MTX24_10430 [Bradyrhizobium sp. ISRA426]WGR78050.1 hypothetical protein MTX21_35400 [Bradyrhizobium sp. ISRA430]WGR88451.1 hypothetical protein MTX25_10440 [Bradyrhizobium sp. ISRA432]
MRQRAANLHFRSRVSNGHAIELRLCAEAPERGYLPTTGKVLLLEYPDGVRIDSGIMQGPHITPAFDPMLAEIIMPPHRGCSEGPSRRSRTGSTWVRDQRELARPDSL